MIQVTTAEARARLPELLAAAAGGEGVEIRAENGRTFRLIANRPRPPVTGVPRAGSCRGLIEVSDDWDAPLEDLREYTE
jgi:antitoxin (DNA-binding transcriptional repressor) of toxin-antitoxin stability system